MANLRTNNLSGEQGQNAYRGSVFFAGNDTGTALRAVESDSNLTFGTGDFTIEFWVLRNNTDQAVYLDWRNAGGAQGHRVTLYSTSNNLYFYSNGTNHIGTTDPLNTNSWHHVAFTRASSSTKLFVNGVQVGSTYSDSNDYVGPQSSDGIYIGRFAGGSYDTKGYISNLRIVKGTALYTGTFTPPQSELTVVDGTVLLCCQDSDDATKDAVGTTITTEGNLNNTDLTKQQPKVIPPYGVDAGNAFGGPIQQSSQGYMYFPTGRTEERGRGRGVLSGGRNDHAMQFVNIQSQGNSQTFGDSITGDGIEGFAVGSSTRGLFSGGYPSVGNVIEFITFATTSNGIDFGDMTQGRRSGAGAGNETRGLFAGGLNSSGTSLNVIEFSTIATLGDSTDFGDLTQARDQFGGCSDTTRAIFAGGVEQGVSQYNIIDFVTIATTGNAQDFGDTTALNHGSSASSDSTRGVIVLGYTAPAVINTIDFITIQSAGNAQDFGDLTQAGYLSANMSNSTRAVIAGRGTLSASNTIDFVTIQTTGNAIDFGDLIGGANFVVVGTSDSHGGLS